MTKLVVVAVLALAAVATGDAIRPGTVEERTSSPAGGDELLRYPTNPEFALAGSPIHNRVLFRGREYLGADEIKEAFPAPLPGAFFEIAHLASKPDGTVVLAIYGFPAGGEPANAIQVWKDGNLEASFRVRPGTFGGGIGFVDEGRLIGALSPNRLVVTLFTHDGRHAGHRPARS
jgi:hypothetical protein